MSKRVSFGSVTPSSSSKIPQIVTRSEKKRAEVAERANLAMSANPFSMRRFDGTNFTVWKAQIWAYLTIKECADVLTSVKTDKNKTEWDEKNNIAKAIILLSLNDDQAILVCHFETAKEMWERLLEAHEQTSQSSRVSVQRQFFEANMKPEEKAIDYVSRLQRLFSQLRAAGVVLAEETLVARIVSGLGPKYHVFMTNWSNTNVKQTLSELIPRLTSEEELLKKMKVDRTQNLAFIAESRSKPKKGKPPQKRGPDKTKQNFVPRDTSSVRCHDCGKLGHFKSKCPSRKPNVSNQTPKPDVKPQPQEAGIVELPFEEFNVVESMHANADKVASESDWIVDSGATEHITNDASNFIDYRSFGIPRSIKLGNKNQIYGLGYGQLRMASNLGETRREFLLKRVLYAPDIRRKLISVGALTSHGCFGEMSNDKFLLRNKNNEVVFMGKKVGNLYVADIEENPTANATLAEESAQGEDSNLRLWHDRLAHLNFTTIARMAKTDAVVGLDKISLDKHPKASDRKTVSCDSCVLAKHSRTPIPLSSRPKSSKVGQRLHLDICGPVGATTLGGSTYFLLLKDEYSNFRLIYFMKSREQAYNLLKHAIAQIYSDTMQRVRCIVSDCGTEFTSNRTQSYLQENNILHETSAPFCPQQNGFIERENRTVMEACRAMLFHKSLPESLWGEACCVAVYVLNRTLNSKSNLTPYELYYGRKPRLTHMRVFGSVCYVKVQEKKRSGYQRKIEARSKKAIFVGYQRDFTYKVFDPSSNKIYLSKDVIFDENAKMDMSGNSDYQNIDNCIESMQTSKLSNVNESSEDEFEGNVAEPLPLDNEPFSYKQAIASKDADKWQTAMKEEYDSLIKNATWDIVQPPPGKRLIGCKWVYRIKRAPDGSIVRYKARLVAKGFTQQYQIDYFETYSPVVRLDSVRIILSLVARLELKMVQFDIKAAYLYGSLEEEIYMRQPEGFETATGKACKLKRSLYGLKQSGRQWNKCFIDFLKSFNLEPLATDSCVLRQRSGELVIVAIYVDDGIACCKNQKLLNDIITYLKSRFEITTSKADYFVGLEIKQDKNKIYLSQKAYINRLISKFGVEDANPSPVPMLSSVRYTAEGTEGGAKSKDVDVPYRQAIGSLRYLTDGTRPDIAYAVSVLSRFHQAPKMPHWHAVKKLLKYIRGTSELQIVYDGVFDPPLIAYSDADYAGCLDTRRSMSGVIVLCGGGPVIWKATKQTTVAESTTEAEFIACNLASKEVIWCRNFLTQLDSLNHKEATTIKVDNQSTIKLVKNNRIHTKIKQLDIKLMAVRERVERNECAVEYIDTKQNIADIMTKALPQKEFAFLRSAMGLMLIMLLSCLLLASSGEGYKLDLLQNTASNSIKLTSALRKLTIQIKDPCPITRQAEDLILPAVELTEAFKVNTSIIDVTKKLCAATFEKRVIPTFKDLTGCVPINRNKRDISTIIGAANAIAGIIVGVTNLIRGSAEETSSASKQDTLMILAKQVNQSSLATLQDRRAMSSETERELGIVSESGNMHLEQLREEAAQMPILVWMTYHVVNELHAGAANLKAIKRHCLNGKLATREIGEMLELEAMSQLDPEDTIIESLIVHEKEREFEISYRVRSSTWYDVREETVFFSIALALAFIFVVVMLIVNLEIAKSLRTKGSPIYHSTGSLNTSHRYAIDL